MSKVYLADKDTLDSVNEKVGTGSDTESAAPTTLFAGIKYLISALANHVANWTAARAEKIDKLDNLGATGDTGGSTTSGTLMAKINALLTSWTSTRAGYLDNIRSYTITNNTASKTGVLSAKPAYIINLLESSVNYTPSSLINVNAKSSESYTTDNYSYTGKGRLVITSWESYTYSVKITVDGKVLFNNLKAENTSYGFPKIQSIYFNSSIKIEWYNGGGGKGGFYGYIET